MRLQVLAALLLLGGLSTPSTATAGTAPDPQVSERDPRGDVKLIREKEGLTTKDLRAIDLQRFEVGPGDEADEVRFTFEIRKVAPDFEQVFAVTISMPRGDDGDYWSGSVNLSPQHPRRAFTQFDQDHASHWCDDRRATVQRGRDRVWVDVPTRCVPEGRARLKVWALTEGYRRPSSVKSNDTLLVPGLVRLR